MRLIAIILVLLPAVVFSQKKPNTILVDDVSYSQALKAILLLDYNIDKSDSSVGIIYTAPKKIENLNAFVKIQVTTMQGHISIKGEYNVPGLDETFERIENKGMKGSATKEAWGMLERFAQSFNKPIKVKNK